MVRYKLTVFTILVFSWPGKATFEECTRVLSHLVSYSNFDGQVVEGARNGLHKLLLGLNSEQANWVLDRIEKYQVQKKLTLNKTGAPHIGMVSINPTTVTLRFAWWSLMSPSLPIAVVHEPVHLVQIARENWAIGE